MVPVRPPFAMYYEGRSVKSIMFHRKAAPALLAALNEIWDYCQHDQARIDAAGVSKYAGAYDHRYVRGSKTKCSTCMASRVPRSISSSTREVSGREAYERKSGAAPAR
ncbi:hypothetical protein [Bradyrhizobium sp. 144]|uniref:hypothetical protein n=1 Tax=Bradyrhizobium sp. 144 TaxID=2782620 RepID=UPI001FFAB99E|nr:hypothetical protein [Bradyrhizobium sp. 144]MCK1693744.1 hypothetical protein [Bradyrhizobium sp. 144]